jgi:hypothetical protein
VSKSDAIAWLIRMAAFGKQRGEAGVTVVGDGPQCQLDREHASDAALDDRSLLVIDAPTLHQGSGRLAQRRTPIEIPGQMGTAIQNMADRLASLGGSFEIRSTPCGGTTVRGTVPIGKEIRTIAAAG